MKKAIKIILIIVVLVLIVVAGIFGYNKFFKEKPVSNAPVSESKKVDTIKGYDYVLYDRSTDLYKDLYYELKEVLEQEEVDYSKYAEIISKMFIADFYNLDNKITNQDVGGLDFIYSKSRDNFRIKASDTLYKNIESNVYGDREQSLPEVASFSEVTVTKESYNYNSSDDDEVKVSITDPDSYVVKISWQYTRTSNYQTRATIRLVHEDKVLSIISVE